MRKSRYSDEQIAAALRQAEIGTPVADITRKLGISEATFYVFQFAYDIQRNHLGTLIGSPTGGNLRGINGGAFFFVRLPHSHIEVDLPLIGTFPDEPTPDRGLEPDIRVDQTIESITRGQDLVLRAAEARTPQSNQ